MVSYGPFDYTDQEVQALTDFLCDRARHEIVTHYDDACNIVQHYGAYHGPRDQRLWHLLGYISEQEVGSGRGALSAIVVIKSGDGAGRPGLGFFDLERKLGRYQNDDVTTWVAEINTLFAYWPTH